MALRCFSIMCKLHIALIHAASLTGAYEGGTERAATEFQSAVRGVVQLMSGELSMEAGLTSNVSDPSGPSNGTTVADVTVQSTATSPNWTSTLSTDSEVYHVFEATRMNAAGAFASAEIMSSAATLTSQLTARIDGLALGFGNPIPYGFLSSLPAGEAAVAEAKLRVATFLGLVSHAQSNVLAVLTEAVQGRLEPSEMVVLLSQPDTARAVNSRVTAAAAAMGLSEFHVLSVFNCPAGGCGTTDSTSDGTTTADEEAVGTSGVGWAIWLAVGVVVALGAALALYLLLRARRNRRVHNINDGDHKPEVKQQSGGMSRQNGEKIGDTGKDGDEGPLGERRPHQRHMVVGLPMGLPEIGNSDLTDIYSKPLREVYKESTAKAANGEEAVTGQQQHFHSTTTAAAQQRPGSEDMVLFDLDGGQDDSATVTRMSPVLPPPASTSIEEETEEPGIPDLDEYEGQEQEQPSSSIPHAKPGHAAARSKQDLVRVPASSRSAAAKSGLRVDGSGFVSRPLPSSERVDRKPTLPPL